MSLPLVQRSAADDRSLGNDSTNPLEFALSPRSPGDLHVFMDSERMETPNTIQARLKSHDRNGLHPGGLVKLQDTRSHPHALVPPALNRCLAITDMFLESLNWSECKFQDRDFAPLNYRPVGSKDYSVTSRQSNESNASESTTEVIRFCTKVQSTDFGLTKPRPELKEIHQLQSDRSGSTANFLRRKLSPESDRKWSVEPKVRFVHRHASSSSAVSSITDDSSSCSVNEPPPTPVRVPFQVKQSRRAMSFGALPQTKLECDLDSTLEISLRSSDSPPRSPRRSVSFSCDGVPDSIPS
jgi:hypothetical protein